MPLILLSEISKIMGIFLLQCWNLVFFLLLTRKMSLPRNILGVVYSVDLCATRANRNKTLEFQILSDVLQNKR